MPPSPLLSLLPLPLLEFQSSTNNGNTSRTIVFSGFLLVLLVTTALLGAPALMTLLLFVLSFGLMLLLMRGAQWLALRLPINILSRIVVASLLTFSPIALVILYVMLAGTYIGLFQFQLGLAFNIYAILGAIVISAILPAAETLVTSPNSPLLLSGLRRTGWLISALLMAEHVLRLPSVGAALLTTQATLAVLFYTGLSGMLVTRLRTLTAFYPESAAPQSQRIDKVALVASIPIFLLLGLGVLAYLALPQLQTNPLAIYDLPSPEHILGTDRFGRDMLAASLWSTAWSSTAGIMSGLVAAGLVTLITFVLRSRLSIVGASAVPSLVLVLVLLPLTGPIAALGLGLIPTLIEQANNRRPAALLPYAVWVGFHHLLLLTVFLPAEGDGIWLDYQHLIAGVLIPSGGYFYRWAGWYALLTLLVCILIFLPYAVGVINKKHAAQ